MKYCFLLLCGLVFSSCAIFHPATFSEAALKDTIQTTDRNSITLEELTEKYRGQKVLIQVYASYCPYSQDSFKDVVALQKEHKELTYVFLSVDHSYHDWKRGLTDLPVKGDHYYLPRKGKGTLGKFLKLKTIPRFLLVDPTGKLLVYKSSKVGDIAKKI